MAAIYDLLDPEVRKQYPLDSLTPGWQRGLSQPIPRGVPQEQVDQVVAAVTARLPRNQWKAEVVRRWTPAPAPTETAEQTAANRQEDYQAAFASHPPLRRAAEMVAQGIMQGTPAWGLKDRNAEPSFQPTSGLERAAGVAGNVAGFAATTTALTPVLGPVAAGGAAGALSAGTVKQRLASGATMLAGGRAMQALEPVAGAVAKALPAAVGARVAPAVAAVGGAAVFGPGAMWAQNQAERVMGEKVAPLTADDKTRGFLDMLVVNAITHGAAVVRGARAAEAAAPVTPSAEPAAPPPAPARGGTPSGTTEAPGALAPEQQAMARHIADTFASPRMSPEAAATSARTTESLNRALGGQKITVHPEGAAEPFTVTVDKAAYFHGDPEAVRLLGIDKDGTYVPMRFASLAALSEAIQPGGERTALTLPGTNAEARVLDVEAGKRPTVVLQMPDGRTVRQGTNQLGPALDRWRVENEAPLRRAREAIAGQIAERPNDARVRQWRGRLAKIDRLLGSQETTTDKTLAREASPSGGESASVPVGKAPSEETATPVVGGSPKPQVAAPVGEAPVPADQTSAPPSPPEPGPLWTRANGETVPIRSLQRNHLVAALAKQMVTPGADEATRAHLAAEVGRRGVPNELVDAAVVRARAVVERKARGGTTRARKPATQAAAPEPSAAPAPSATTEGPAVPATNAPPSPPTRADVAPPIVGEPPAPDEGPSNLARPESPSTAAPQTTSVRLESGRDIEVQGSGAATYWRDPSDTTSPFAGRFVLASPEFRKEIEAAQAQPPKSAEGAAPLPGRLAPVGAAPEPPAALADWARGRKAHPSHLAAFTAMHASGEMPEHHVSAVAHGYAGFLTSIGSKAALQGEAASAPVTPRQFSDHLGLAYRRIAERIADGERVAADKGSNAALRSIASERLGEARDLAKQAHGWAVEAVKKAIAAGTSVPDALYEVQQRIEKAHPPTPADWGGGMSFMGTGEFGRLLGKVVLDGIPRAVDFSKRAAGKAMKWRITDGHGNGLLTGDLYDGKVDTFAETPLTNHLFAHLQALGAHDLFPPEISTEMASRAPTLQTDLYGKFRDLLHARMAAVGPEWEKYLRAGTHKSEHLFRAANGMPHELAEREMPYVAAYKRFYEDALALLNEHRVSMGQEPIKGLPEYGGPHLIEGEFSSGLDGTIQRLLNRSLGAQELTNLRDRFLEHRIGAERFTTDAAWATDAWIHAAARLMANERPLAMALEHAESFPDTDVRRTAALAWLRKHYFSKKGSFEAAMDRGLRSILFAKHAEQPQQLTAQRAQGWGIDIGPTMARASEFNAGLPEGTKPVKPRFMWMRAGQEALLPTGWEPVGSAHGGTVYAGFGGKVRDVTTPRLHAANQLLANAYSGASVALRRIAAALDHEVWDGPEEGRRAAWKQRQAILRYHASPFRAFTQGVGRGNLVGLVGYNPHTLFLHTSELALKTMPEYLEPTQYMVSGRSPLAGVGVIAEGTARYGAALAGRGARALLDAYVRSGHIGKDVAKRMRDAIPLSPFEVGRKGAGSAGSDIDYMGPVFKQHIGEEHPDVAWRRAAKTLAPLGPLHTLVAFMRGWDAAIHMVGGMREGLDPGTIGERWAWSRENEARMIQQLSREGLDPRMAESRAMALWPRTMADYSMGRGAYMNGTLGRLLTQFSLWSKEYALNWVFRPTEGMARTLVKTATLGRSRLSPTQLHYAGVFATQALAFGAMSALSDHTKWNWLPFAAAPHIVLLCGLLHTLMPRRKDLERWLAMGEEAAGHTGLRGISQPGDPVANFLGSFGPTASFLVESAEEIHRNLRATEQKPGRGGWPAVGRAAQSILPLQTASGMLSAQTRLPVNEMRKLVRENPEILNGTTRQTRAMVYEVLGVHTTIPHLTPEQKVANELGMLKPQDKKRLTRPVPKVPLWRHTGLVGATP